jgi:hypothetical protein
MAEKDRAGRALMPVNVNGQIICHGNALNPLSYHGSLSDIGHYIQH